MDKLLIISKFTFKEIVKSKILLNTLFLGLVLLIVTYVAYSFTYGEPQRIALDFGLGMLSLSSVGIAIFFGVGLLSSEIESRTVYMIISRPVPRYAFYLGKIFGLSGVLILNIFILSFMTLLMYFSIGGDFNPLIFWSIIFIIIESIIVLLVVCVLTMIATPTISILSVIVLYISGHAIPAAQNASFAKTSEALSFVLELYHFILPGFYKFNIKNFVLYTQNLDWAYLVSTFAYGLLYAFFLLFLGIFLFDRKNLD